MDILFMKKLIYFVNFVSHATNIDMTQDDSINGTRTGRGTDFRCGLGNTTITGLICVTDKNVPFEEVYLFYPALCFSRRLLFHVGHISSSLFLSL